jgi:Asp-tRNA(Asn)/Glu-tRNA(Gln) amidotransferase A subunit family amidase
MTDLTQLTAVELSSLYQSGTVGPVAVAEQILAKIERLNPAIRAFCFTDPDTTLTQAHASESRWKQRRPLSMLDGIPVSVKDSILVQGWPTLRGSCAVDPDQPWLEDDPAVATFRAAGAVFLGKTAVPEFNLRSDTYSPLTGISRNPWNTDYSPGGSSGGSAAAVAAGLGPISLGSDQTGSITIPAAFCGVAGFKPSGHTVTGPVARTTNDLRFIWQTPATAVDVNSLKIFYLRNDYFNETVTYTDSAVEMLRSQGFIIPQYELGIDYLKIIEIAKNIGQRKALDIFQSLSAEQRLRLDSYFQHIASNKVLYLDNATVSKTVKEVVEKTQEFDIVITSSANVTACRAHKLPTIFYLMKKHNRYDLLPSHSCLWNITGQPAVTVPAGLADNGLPVGIQIVGRVGQDNLVLQFANAIEPLFPKLHSPLM